MQAIRKREVCLTSGGHYLSYSQIANYLCFKRAVPTMIERAEKENSGKKNRKPLLPLNG
ncbi:MULTISPECIES: hypothetical protein [Aeribacillus]|uniref:hypothetical protein n=1 Tax=Aeribacillus TaxID=1055323 RepID=UPI0013EE7DBC|nr:hypothetical protein [Aeribacillus pallidus]